MPVPPRGCCSNIRKFCATLQNPIIVLAFLASPRESPPRHGEMVSRREAESAEVVSREHEISPARFSRWILGRSKSLLLSSLQLRAAPA